MLRRLVIVGIAAFALAACHKSSSAKQSGPVIAKGDGFTITADEFKARLDEQSPFMRARYSTLDKKKEFLDNLVRFEVLAREAEKQGYRDDPDVQQTLRKIMVQKLVQKRFNDPTATPAAVPDADVQKYYDEHAAEFHRPKRVRASVIVLQAAKDSPDRARKLAEAKKALAGLQAPPAPPAPEKKPAAGKPLATPAVVKAPEAPRPGDPMAFNKLVAELSDDATSKAANGDIGLKTAEEIEKAYSKELADALFSLKQGELSGVVEGPQAIYLAKVTLVQEEVNRTLEQVKPQITARLSREKKSKEFDEWLKKLKDSAGVTIDDKALDAVEVSAPQAPGAAQPAGMPPPPPGMSAPPPPPGGAMTPMPRPGGEVKPAGSTAPAK